MKRIKSEADSAPIDIVWHIWPTVGSTGLKPIMPVTIIRISPDVKIVWIEPLYASVSDCLMSIVFLFSL